MAEEVGAEGLTERIGEGGHGKPEDSPAAEEEEEEKESKVTRVEILGRKRWDKRFLGRFPPFLSTLYESGRPRLELRKERSNGRLVITAHVRQENFNERQMILTGERGRQGGTVRMWMPPSGCGRDQDAEEIKREED